MRKRIFEIIEKSKGNDKVSFVYDIFMLAVIFISIVPVTIKEPGRFLIIVDYTCAYIFIIDYVLRWLTADYKINREGAFLIYPFTPFAIIDLLAILPTFGIISRFFRVAAAPGQNQKREGYQQQTSSLHFETSSIRVYITIA